MRDAGEDGVAGCVELVHDLDAEAVLFERDDRVRDGPVVGEGCESLRGLARAHAVGSFINAGSPSTTSWAACSDMGGRFGATQVSCPRRMPVIVRR